MRSGSNNGSGSGLFGFRNNNPDPNGQLSNAQRKRQRKLEDKRSIRERKTRILRDSIIVRKNGDKDVNFASTSELRFSTPSVNAVTQKIQAMVKKVFSEVKDPSNKEAAMNKATDSIMHSLTGRHS